MAVIQIESEDQFKQLLENLARELVDANVHWTLQKDLIAQLEPFSAEFNQSMTFWSLTFQAQLDAAIFRLIHIYDGNSKALSLRNFLDTVSANLEVFETKQYRQRLKDNPFVESLAADARKPDPGTLKQDLAFVSNDNDLVNRLTIWRNNLFAHKSAQNAMDEYDIAAHYPLAPQEIGVLLEEGMRILNRYSLMFMANAYSTDIIGRNDYQYVLDCVRSDLARRRNVNL